MAQRSTGSSLRSGSISDKPAAFNLHDDDDDDVEILFPKSLKLLEGMETLMADSDGLGLSLGKEEGEEDMRSGSEEDCTAIFLVFYLISE